MHNPRVIIVGAGLMGRWHAYYARHAGARVVGVVDPERRLDGERHFDQLKVALDAQRPDIAHLCTPTETHAPLARECLAAGIHVLCEKPLAARAGETEDLLREARQRGLSLGVAHQFPYQRGLRNLRRRFTELGTVEEARFVAATSGADGYSRGERSRILHEILPHPLSLFAFLFGNDSLDAEWLKLRDDADRLEMTAEHEGVRLSLVLSATARPACNQLTISGDRAQGFADLFQGYSMIHRAADTRIEKALRPFRMAAASTGAAAANLLDRARLAQPAYPGLAELIADFYRCAGTGGTPLADADTPAAIARVVETLRS